MDKERRDTERREQRAGARRDCTPQALENSVKVELPFLPFRERLPDILVYMEVIFPVQRSAALNREMCFSGFAESERVRFPV